jgi:hypothetical protein
MRGRHLRPLLSLERRQLLGWARAQGLRWIDDDSNADPRFDRNYLRLHQVLPAHAGALALRRRGSPRAVPPTWPTPRVCCCSWAVRIWRESASARHSTSMRLRACRCRGSATCCASGSGRRTARAGHRQARARARRTAWRACGCESRGDLGGRQRAPPSRPAVCGAGVARGSARDGLVLAQAPRDRAGHGARGAQTCRRQSRSARVGDLAGTAARRPAPRRRTAAVAAGRAAPRAP